MHSKVAVSMTCLMFAGFAQIIVDDEHCSSFHDSCGRSFSEKYCCADGNGGVYLFSCCNPYIGSVS